MTALLLAAGAAAVLDWVAVEADLGWLEEVAKPLVIILLLAWVLTAEAAEGSVRGWVAAALLLSLVGDVALLPRLDQFVLGLGAFLLGHLAYLPALLPRAGLGPTLVAALVLAPLAVLVGGRIARAADVSGGRVLSRAVSAYVLAVGATAVLAVGTAALPVVLGGVAFAISDGVLGWNRFVAPIPHGRTVVHVTYHLAQAGLASAVLLAVT